ncbi:WD40 repeat domain-containing protein [Streptomyces sp. NPDC101175]|uniref:WD40 repeat domain-containing protein n=1 Tax=Streptomyces sp. NPDC101175 TaxID=3366123 RepID=UPI0038325A2D
MSDPLHLSLSETCIDLGRALTALREQHGSPSLRAIEAHGLKVLGPDRSSACSLATMSTAFRGTKFISHEKLLWLVRAVMAFDENGAKTVPPGRRAPELNEWRERWTALNRVRTRDQAASRYRRHVKQRQPAEPSVIPLAARIAQGSMQRGEPIFLRRLQRYAYVTVMAFPHDEDTLVLGQGDGSVYAFNLTQREDFRLAEHSTPLVSLALSSIASPLATVTRDGTPRLWVGIQPGEGEYSIFGWNRKYVSLEPQSCPVVSVAVSPSGGLLACCGRDGVVRFWDTETRTMNGPPLEAHSGPALSAVFSHTGRRLASSGQDGVVRLWDVESRSPVGAPLDAHVGPQLSLAFSPGDHLLATADGVRVRLWDTATSKYIGGLRGESGPVDHLSFSPSGILATGDVDGIVRLWSLGTYGSMGRRLRHNGRVHAMAFSADSSVLAVSAGKWVDLYA